MANSWNSIGICTFVTLYSSTVQCTSHLEHLAPHTSYLSYNCTTHLVVHTLHMKLLYYSRSTVHDSALDESFVATVHTLYVVTVQWTMLLHDWNFNMDSSDTHRWLWSMNSNWLININYFSVSRKRILNSNFHIITTLDATSVKPNSTVQTDKHRQLIYR